MELNRRTLIRTTLTASCLMAATGCRDEDLMNHRRFILTNIDGIALPALEHETVTGRYVALADTIVFTSGTRGIHTRVYRVEPKIAQPVETIRLSSAFTYEVSPYTEDSSLPAGTITVTYICMGGPAGDCLAGPHVSGLLTDHIMKLHILHRSPERERRYAER